MQIGNFMGTHPTNLLRTDVRDDVLIAKKVFHLAASEDFQVCNLEKNHQSTKISQQVHTSLQI